MGATTIGRNKQKRGFMDRWAEKSENYFLG